MKRLSDIIKRISCNNGNDGGRFITQPVLTYDKPVGTEKDVVGAFIQFARYDQREKDIQKGRKWYISQYATEDEVIRTCLLAVKTFEEHEVLERFLVDGKKYLSPHPEGMRKEGAKTWEDLF